MPLFIYLTFYIIRVIIVLADQVVRRFRTEFLVVILLVVGIVIEGGLAGRGDARHMSMAARPIGRQGHMDPETAVGMRLDALRLQAAVAVEQQPALGVKTDGAMPEVPDHLELKAVVAEQETLRAQRELRIQGGIVIVAGQVPDELRLPVILPLESDEIPLRDQPQLRVDPETLVGEPVSGLERGAEAVARELSDRELAQDIEMPGVPEPLGEGDDARMDQVILVLEEIGEDRDDELIGETGARPEVDLKGRFELPQGLVDLRDDQVRQREHRIDRDVRPQRRIVHHRLLPDGIPGGVETLGRVPGAGLGAEGNRDLGDLAGRADELDGLGGVQAAPLEDLHGAGKSLGGQLVVVVFNGEGRELRRLDGADVDEAGLDEALRR